MIIRAMSVIMNTMIRASSYASNHQSIHRTHSPKRKQRNQSINQSIKQAIKQAITRKAQIWKPFILIEKLHALVHSFMQASFGVTFDDGHALTTRSRANRRAALVLCRWPRRGGRWESQTRSTPHCPPRIRIPPFRSCCGCCCGFVFCVVVLM